MPGSVALVSVTTDRHLSGEITGSFDGSEFPFFPMDSHSKESQKEGEHVYGALFGVDYYHPTGTFKVKISAAQGDERQDAEVALQINAGDYPSEALHVNPSRVSPKGPRTLKRIKREQAEVGAIYHTLTRTRYWSGPFGLPIQSQITSRFGTKRLYNGSLKNFHPGLDLKAQTPTPIRVAAGGVVVMAKSLFYTGYTVIVDHGFGVVTLYCHMSKILVHLGQVLRGDEVLGLSGATGRVNGPHLHWQAVVHHVKVDPLGLTQLPREPLVSQESLK